MREWLIGNGVWGLALLMFLQNLLPLIPSEIIMPLAGFLASLGYWDVNTVVLAGLLGSVLGHLPWYFVGSALGEDRLEGFFARHGRLFLIRPSQVHKAGDWFDRHTVKAVLLGRLIPGLRTCVNIPAGATHMAFLPYLAYTMLGDAIWTALLGYGGFLLGRDYILIAKYLHMAMWPLIALAGAVFVWHAWRRHARRQRPA
jgi:membrane protein DedA with SNARE-associated domain